MKFLTRMSLATLGGKTSICRWMATATLGLAALGVQAAPSASVEAAPKPVATADAAEAVWVDPSLFTTQIFQWKDAARDRSVPAKLYLPAGPTLGAGAVPLVVFSSACTSYCIAIINLL